MIFRASARLPKIVSKFCCQLPKKVVFLPLAPRAPDPVSKGAMLRMAGQDNKQLGIYLSVLMGGGLNAWRNPAIVRATKTNDFDFESMRWEPQTCYISIPEAH